MKGANEFNLVCIPARPANRALIPGRPGSGIEWNEQAVKQYLVDG
ncbi:MAG: hypothetical protein O7A69_11080 [SAR324 cluster bacterium]|nr:hypothetical protein [SAR324 cluster bacterium]